nr:hypothetical protein [Hyphomonas sp.]
MHSDIEFIVQDTGAATPVAVDGAGCPSASALSRNTFGIELRCDLLRGFALRIVGKNASHDGSLLLVDLALAADAIAFGIIARLDVIAVALAAGAFAVDRSLFLSAMHAARQVLKIERRHRSLEANVQLADLALHQRDDRDVPKPQTLVHMGDVFLIAAQAIDRLREDDVKLMIKGSR